MKPLLRLTDAPTKRYSAVAVVALLMVLSPGGCASQSVGDAAGDFGVSVACGAREGVRNDQCRERHDVSGDTMAYGRCLDSCRAAAGPKCRPKAVPAQVQ